MLIPLATLIVFGVAKIALNTIVSAMPSRFALRTACRSDPAPPSFVLVTVKVAGTVRSSSRTRPRADGRAGRTAGRVSGSVSSRRMTRRIREPWQAVGGGVWASRAARGGVS